MQNKIILLSSETIGNGDVKLGEVLMENFFTILKQKPNLPSIIYFINSGVQLLLENSFVSLHLKELEVKGVQIIACKTCTEFYSITDKIQVGTIGTMAQFIELASTMEVVTIN